MPPTTTKPTPALIASLLPPEHTYISSTQIATLWSGYGYIHRIHTTTPTSTLILKTISPPPTSTRDESHLRKLLSYNVERWFYHHLAPHLPPTPSSAKIAKAFPPSKASAPALPSADVAKFLLLEDLTAVGFPRQAAYGCTKREVLAVLRWLARFHAAFWGYGGGGGGGGVGGTEKGGASPRTVPPPLEADFSDKNLCEGIWRNGGYWYLATRRAENEEMVEAGGYPWLRQRWVEEVAERLARPGRAGVDGGVLGATVVHGDCKGANILFSGAPMQPKGGKRGGGDEDVEAALYDFQYVGLGYGTVDLAYFMGTTVPAQLLEGGGDAELLGYYYAELMKARGVGVEGEGEGGYTREVFGLQMDWAVVDWMRFMAGWGTWGSGARWVERRARRAVERFERVGGVDAVVEGC